MAIENRGPELQAVCYTLITAATIAISLRVYVRTCIVKNFGIDDYLMVFAYIFFSLFVSFALVGVHYGTGRHRADLDAEDFKQAMMYWWYCYLWYCLSMITSKISIGYFLLRITVRRIDIFLVYGTMCITVLTGAIFFFVTLLQCRPISFFWNRDQEGSCINVEVIIALTYLYSVFSVISDFTCAILPMFLVWKLNMDRRSKIALIPIMAMACVASSAVVVRFPFVKDFRNPDFLWATLDIALWSTTEQGLAVTAGSLATLRPLLRILAAKFGTLTTNKSGLQSSDQLGSGYRGQPKSGGSQPRSRAPFSLTTFMRGDDDAYRIEDEEESRSGKFRNDLHDKSWTRDVVSEWPSRGGGSDEELTGPSRETRSKSIKVTTSIRQEEHKI